MDDKTLLEQAAKAAGIVELGFALHDIPPEGSTLRKLGKRLAELLDKDQWAECEQMLFELSDEMKALKYSLQLDEELIGMIQKIITVLNNRPAI